LDAARTLLGQGYSPDTILTMRHEGSQTEALRAPIGTAAELVISGGRFVAREKATGAAGKPEEGIDQDGVPLDAELAGGAAAHVPDAVGQMLYCGRTLRGGWVRR
jgi:hypothetical protein